MNKLALIDLIHSDPLYEYGKEKFQISRGSTWDNLQSILNGDVDYAMVSLVDYFKNIERLKIVNGPTISGKTHSQGDIVLFHLLLQSLQA